VSDDTVLLCWSCRQEIPHGAFCVRCGTDLARERWRRDRFRASPNEHRLSPRITSSVFPRLPRAALRGFRLALFVALAAIVALALAGSYPLAIVVAAVSVPVLSVIYLYDVDVYEDEPLIVLALTALWGSAMGVALGLFGRALAPSSADLLTQSTRETLLQQGVALPLAGLLLALLGPLVLLPYRRFDDVLDGATFGATSAVWLVASQLLTQASSLFDDGLQPGGSRETWLLRLLQLGLTMPLLWAGAGGAAAGSFWLRYRARAGLRPSGISGRPALAVSVASGLVVVAAVGQIVLELRAALALSALLAVVALFWLRQLIDAGLKGESAEREIGPEITCANCRDLTPRHTFCAWCGIALAALPKGRESSGDGFVPGSEPARLRNRIVLGVFGVALVTTAVISSGALAKLAPSEEQACLPGQPCGGPPSTSPPLVSGQVWRSSEGIALEYDPGRWDVENADDEALTLRSGAGEGWVEIRVEDDRGSQGTKARGLPRWLKAPTELGLPVPHGPNVGYVDGRGAWYEGLLDSPQGPRQTVTVATLSSARARKSVVVSAVFFGPAAQAFSADAGLRSSIDSILNTVTWPLASAGRAAPVPAGSAGAGRPGGLRPDDIARAYGLRPLWTRGFRGQGETIAVVSLDTFRAEDVAEYERLVGIDGAPSIERVQVDGEVPLGSGAQEVSLDLEVIRATAPEASIVNYEAELSWEGFVAALKRVNDDGRARLVSVSWGKCLTHVDEAVVGAMERELDRAYRAGRTIFASSGDSGAFSCLHTENELDADQHRASVDWPAASPSVVAVGGTRLTVREDGSYYSENGWEDTLSSDGSGGGISPLHRRPRWQREGVVPSPSRYRHVPDVAGPADCDSAFLIVYPEWSGEEWTRKTGAYGCGTSAAAPFWTGVAALVLQYARDRGHERLGFLGTLLYALPRNGPGGPPLNDVQTGGNLMNDAGPGWDYATGLGTPNAWNLARAVVALADRFDPHR
jgi:Subtilase family